MLFLKKLFLHGPIEYGEVLNRSIWPIDGILTDTTTPSQRWPGSNGNEGLVHTPWRRRIGNMEWDAI